jgi:lipoyl(octanoyl) transferase
MRPLTRHAFLDVEPLGEGVPYEEGMARMRAHMEALDSAPLADAGTLLLLEHAPVITVTRSGGLQHLKASADELERDGFALMEADRGGDVTFHGPGQLVGYPVVRLRDGDDGRADLLGYLRALEGALVSACTRFGVEGCHVRDGMTGVWVGDGPHDPAGRKLVAIGVGVRRGVTRHGFALNVDIELDAYTSRVTPCGLSGYGVTSLERELGGEVPDEATRVFVVTQEIASALSLKARFDTTSTSRGRAARDGAAHA